VIEKTLRNLDRFFNPALRVSDPHYLELQQRDLDTLWTSYQEVSSADTDYAGRATEFLRGGLDSGKEAWMADDNENGWAFRDGSIHILYGDGAVVTLSALDLKQRFGWGPIKADVVFKTCGPDSPHPDLRKLAQ
jgi:hypothetical protein